MSSSQPVPTLSHVTAIGPLKRLTCSSRCVTSTFAPIPSKAAACGPRRKTCTPMARSPSGTSTSRAGVLVRQRRGTAARPRPGFLRRWRWDLERMLDAADAALGILRRHLHAIAAGPQPERHRVERRHRVDFLGLAVAPAVAVQHFIGEARASIAAGERRCADSRGHEHLRLHGSVRHQRRGDPNRHRLQHDRRAERGGERLGRLAEAPRLWLRGELGAVADGYAALAPQRHLMSWRLPSRSEACTWKPIA